LKFVPNNSCAGPLPYPFIPAIVSGAQVRLTGKPYPGEDCPGMSKEFISRSNLHNFHDYCGYVVHAALFVRGSQQ